MKKLLLIPLFAFALAAQEPAEHKEGAAEHAEEHSSEPAPIWKWANFAILAVGIGYWIQKVPLPFLRARNSQIQMGISEAQKMKQDAEKRSAEMDARLNSLGTDIEKFRTESAVEMQQEGDRISRETAEQIKKVEQQATVEIESVGKTTRRQLKEYAAELALGLAEERLRAQMNGATESKLVDEFAKDLERHVSQNPGSKN